MPKTEQEKCVIKKVELSKRVLGKLIDYVETTARKRKASIGKLKEDDFFCGAMSVMYALGNPPPTGWVIGLMCDRPDMYGMEDKNGRRK